MNNTQLPTENKTIKISEDVEVWEFAEGENPRSDVKLNIPFRFGLCGIRPLSEYKRIALEDIRIKISTVFEMVEFFGEEIRAGSYSEKYLKTVNEFSLLLGVFGKGLTEALEVTENSFERYEQKNTKLAVVDADGKNSAAAPAKGKRTEQQRQTLAEISQQLEMALTNDETPDDVKECLKTIIFEAGDEAGLPLGDLRLVRAAFPNIIEALPKDYGTGIYHSIHAILRHNTTAFQEFYDKHLDDKGEPQNSETDDLDALASQLSAVMKHPKLPARIYEIISDEFVQIPCDTDSPEWILANLKSQLEKEGGKNE